MYSNELMNRQNVGGCYAVKVRSRTEIAVSAALRDKGFEVLMPTYTDRRRYSDRIKKTTCALFPGYAFVRMEPDNLSQLATTPGVNYVVMACKTLCPMPPDEEFTLRTLCGMDGGFEPCDDFAIGEPVNIETGPFRGYQGILVRKAGKERVVLSLSSILSSVSIDLRNTVIKACKSSRELRPCTAQLIPEMASGICL